jgi:hypothetical protein
MSLAITLLTSQIEAANRLQSFLANEAPTDRALYSLKERFPGFDSDAVLLKVAAINQLYATQVWAIGRMARHVVQVMNGPDALSRDHVLIETLAALPKADEKHSARNHLSFASKFAHFFVDSEAFPIYDTFAVGMTGYHLGRREEVKDPLHPYRAFLQNLTKLRLEAGLNLQRQRAGLIPLDCRSTS